jgi:hypothetical protein
MKIPKYIEKLIEDENNDHIECYRTRGKYYIIINSPYRDDLDDYYESKGWVRIYDLYMHNARTYMKRIPLIYKGIL